MAKIPNILEFTKQAMKMISHHQGFDRLAKCLNVVEAHGNGRVLVRWNVLESQLNAMGTLHGGCTAFLVDHATTVSLIVMDKNIERKPGVSVDLSVSYLNAAKEGDEVTLETGCTKLGRKLAFMDAVLKKKDGTIIATAKHTKFLL